MEQHAWTTIPITFASATALTKASIVKSPRTFVLKVSAVNTPNVYRQTTDSPTHVNATQDGRALIATRKWTFARAVLVKTRESVTMATDMPTATVLGG